MPNPRPRPFRKPKGSYTQARRLIELYDRLHRGGLLHAERLADDLRVSRRTIERDLVILDDVLEGGLERREQPEPGWALKQRPRPWATTRWQVLAVAVGARMAGFLSGRRFDTHVAPLMTQLLGALDGTQGHFTWKLDKKIHIVESGHKLYRERPELQRRLEVMLDGLLKDRPIDLTYASSKTRAEGKPARPMRVHALALVLHRASVYFIVDPLDPDSGERRERRLLAVDRILDAQLDASAEVLAVPRGFDARKFLATAFAIWTGVGDHHVTLEISRSQAMFVTERHWHESERIDPLPNGGVRLTLDLGELEEVAQWVVGMGPDAKVIGPPALRTLVRDRLGRALQQY